MTSMIPVQCSTNYRCSVLPAELSSSEFFSGFHNCTQISDIFIPLSAVQVPKRCRTTTYQKSFFIRSTRIWNLFTGRMDLANATLTSFKSLLYDYYSRAVRMNYNPDNPRSFKTICLKCNSIRFLDVPIMCCM